MFQKMKKSKGFTLIEMLVVIAIIAVLVSIIIPVVGNSTTKAKAAADAANLRSVQSELTITTLSDGDFSADKTRTETEYSGVACKTNKDWKLVYIIDKDGAVKTYFKDASNNYYDINSFSTVAENGGELKACTAPTTKNTSTTTPKNDGADS